MRRSRTCRGLGRHHCTLFLFRDIFPRFFSPFPACRAISHFPCLEQGRVAPYAVGSSDELCDRLMPNGTTRTTSWTTSTSSSTTEENSEITGRKSWIAKAGTYNQLEMTGHGNDNEGNQQPVHQDNSLPECLPELIPEELCCHPCPPTLPKTPVRTAWLHSAP